MHLPLPAGLGSTLDQGAAARPFAARKMRLLAAGASVLALGIVHPSPAAAQNAPGVLQHTEDDIAINLFELNLEEIAQFGATETVNNAGGHALAEAIVACAGTATCPDAGGVFQFARGVGSAANTAAILGNLSIGADAVAQGASATAAGLIQIGISQVAAAEGFASNDLFVTNALAIGAGADAAAQTGDAVAFAGIGAGVSQIASSIGTAGAVSNFIYNSGELTVIAGANAGAALGDAVATAFVDSGLLQDAQGDLAAGVEVNNVGNVLVQAGASAEAPEGIAAASASAAGIVQFADARTQQFASTLTTGGVLIGIDSDTPSGPASATLSNNGVIHVDVDAAALGGLDASATGAVLGAAQFVSGSQASAVIVNSGSIHIDATADVESSGTPRGVVFVSGLSQAASAFAYSTAETIDPAGVLTYELTASPVGPAVALLVNASSIAIAGEVDVVGHGTGSTAEALGVAFVDGLDQFANGNDALAEVDNRGGFFVSADVSVDSGNLANAVAVASGIDQNATAHASQLTVVFANGTTTPTTITGSSTAIGPAKAKLDNSGLLSVIASVDSHGDETAFAGATASAIGQFAAGTDARVTIGNSGAIVSRGIVASSGRTAFGGAAAIGIQQAAQASDDAQASLDNGVLISVLASAQGQGEAGAFINATAFGIAQNVLSDGAASASIANSGTIEIGALASAVAGDAAGSDSAIAFAAAHGIGQLAQGSQAEVLFENGGTFEMLADVDAVADDFALASAIASGAVQQLALGTASGTAAAHIDNSGTILLGAEADAAAGSTAVAIAGVNSAMAQLVMAGEGGSATLANSGSIAMIADAEALAAGGDATDTASAQAYVFGIHAAVTATATGVPGFANVSLSNAGAIDVNGMAHATGDGFARALATAAYGLVGNATVAGTGPAEVALTNEGSIDLIGIAEATGGHTANATGIAVAGMDAFAAGGGEAIAAITNSGEVTMVADAHASAGTNALAVSIAIDALQASAHAGSGDAVASIANGGELEMISNAEASALNAQAFAYVGGTFFTGVMFESAAAMNGNASVLADNSGSISVAANALANGEVIATASAVGGPGINQFAFATGGDAFASIDNSGSIDFSAHGEANAANSAYADALFYNAVAQFANGNGGRGVLDLANEGSISIAVVAEADGDAVANAYAKATHDIGQSGLVFNNDAVLELENSGSIAIDVAAIVEGSHASATAELGTAMYQTAAALGDGEASAVLDNSGSIDFGVLASVDSPDGYAGAFAVMEGAISQYAGAGSSEYLYGSTPDGLTQITQNIFPTGPASLLLDNSGSLDIAVAALAEGGTSAQASANGHAIDQFARGLDATASIVNDGSMTIGLQATADADGNAAAVGSITAVAQAAAAAETTVHITATDGGGQVTDSVMTPVGSGLVSFENTGTFELTGIASAQGAGDSASASMTVLGIEQSVLALDAEAVFANGGEYSVGARAEATGGTGAAANASVTGYSVSGGDYSLDFGNDGDFTVIAEAVAEGSGGQAAANAVAIVAAGDGLLSGAIANNADLLVRAEAEGAGSAVAEATGIRIGSNADGLTVTNSGILAVSASTDGGTGNATGIGTFDTGTLGAAGIAITNDGGTIIARVSNDGGTTWVRGTALDLSAASAGSVVTLAGDGAIAGNIDLALGQAITVTGGETSFDGIINAECGGLGCGEGALTIASGAALFFRHDSTSADGPSGAFLEELNVESGGSLILQMPTGDDPEAAYPRIVTGVANLDGALLIRSGLGLYADSYTFDDVIDAGVRNGEFESCGIAGDPALLALNCVYDTAGNVDLGIERIAFNAVAGLTRNQAAAGSGIEAVYDIGLDGPFGAMVEQLFTFGDEDYGAAIGQLTGASHAAYLQSYQALGIRQNALIDRASGCELPGREISSLSCRDGKMHLWGQVDVAERGNDGDLEAPGYDADQLTAALGGDVEVGTDVVVGASFGALRNRVDFHDGARAKGEGYQLGGYAAFDPGGYYAKAIGTIGWFDGDSSRVIDWEPLGGTLSGRLDGDSDVRLWTLGAHFGYRVPLGASSLLTPFLDIDHVSARLDGFSETGVPGANLAVEDSTAAQTAVTVGSKWTAQLGRIVPQVEVGYRYRLGDRRSEVGVAFADEPGSDFDIVSSAEKRGSLLAGASIGGRAGPVDLRLGYQGQFDGASTSHSANFRIVLPLGGQ